VCLRQDIRERRDDACGAGEEALQRDRGGAGEDGERRGREGGRKPVQLADVRAAQLGADNVRVLSKGREKVRVKVNAYADVSVSVREQRVRRAYQR
jgi:hypothetical protein